MQQSLDQDHDQGQVKGTNLYPGVTKDHQTTNSTSSSSASPPTVLKREQDVYPGQIQLYPPSPYSEHQLQQQEPADQHKYNLSKHLLAMNMTAQQHQQHSTPASAFSTAPSSPTLNPLQYNPSNNSGGSNNNINSTNASGTTTPYGQHPSYSYHSQSSQHHPLHPYHYQQHQQAPDLANSYYYNHNSGNSNGTGANPVSSTAPSPMRQQQPYSSLAPPLTDTQYAQMLGPFSSTQSTPYHSSQSTPYSSIPPSPTQAHAQLYGGDHLHERIKRRQVKNACGKFSYTMWTLFEYSDDLFCAQEQMSRLQAIRRSELSSKKKREWCHQKPISRSPPARGSLLSLNCNNTRGLFSRSTKWALFSLFLPPSLPTFHLN